jgi:serine/threonine protein kinase
LPPRPSTSGWKIWEYVRNGNESMTAEETRARSPADGAAPHAAAFVGSILDGKYRIDDVIGAGSMGTVFRARHLTLSAWRAIKVMRADLAEDENFVERFQLEARLLEGLRHPNLVALYDFARLPDGTWYIVSEFVEGETLAAFLAAGKRLTPSEAVSLCSQIADGMAAAHDRGVVHRDLSPENIMISSTSAGARTAKVLDFGLAKQIARDSSVRAGHSLMAGKLGYAAPEQMGLVADARGVDHRADVFSLAAILYRVLAGRLPWRADGLHNYVHDLLMRPESALRQDIAAGVPREWRDLFSLALARHPGARTPTMALLKRDILQASSVAAIKPQSSRPATGARRTLVIGGLTAVAMVSGFAAYRLLVVPLNGSRTRATTPAASETAPPALKSSVDAVLREAPLPSLTVRETTRATPAVSVREQAPDLLVATPSSVEASPSSAIQVAVRSDPLAEVRIDDERRGRTPVTLELPAGRHRMTLISDDGQAHSEDLTLSPGKSVVYEHVFPGFGRLSVIAEPWMEVRVDGGPYQQTPAVFEKVNAGSHIVEGRRPGFAPVRLEVSVARGESRAVRIEPRSLDTTP